MENTSTKFFEKQLEENAVSINPGKYKNVVIRCADGDYTLAAVHADGDTLIFDLGVKI